MFWALWPYIVSKQTQKYWQKCTGQQMPKARADRLHRELTAIRREMKNPVLVK